MKGILTLSKMLMLSLLAMGALSCASKVENQNVLENCSFSIGETYDSPFLNKVDIYQDGTVPMYRDAQGQLWALSGHSHMGHIGVFKGTSLEDMTEAWPMVTDFTVGAAGEAFAGIRYPEGVLARGSIWPFGLYICPKTGRFFCFFHNETGWNGKGTAYDSFGPCEVPAYDSDFRHIGLMHSDDEGRTWTFDRWILTSENVCFTQNYNPGAGKMVGQKPGVIDLGSGDFSLFVEPDGEFMYIVYNKVTLDMDAGKFLSVDTYLARTRKRDDGVMGDFVKYYDGSFCESGNFGKETAIAHDTWHSRVAYSETLGCYLMASSPIGKTPEEGIIADYMEVRTSSNLTDWSEPVSFMEDGSIVHGRQGDKPFGNHYQAIISFHGKDNPAVVSGQEFTVMECHNGTDVRCHDFKFKMKR